MNGNPIADERARMVSRNFVVSGAQVPQPAETVQFPFPGVAGRLYRERRTHGDDGDGAGKTEMTMIDLACEAGVSRAQILRHKQQLADLMRPIAPPHQARAQQPPPSHTPGTICRGRCQPRTRGKRINVHPFLLAVSIYRVAATGNANTQTRAPLILSRVRGRQSRATPASPSHF